jgi:hypothetical protein
MLEKEGSWMLLKTRGSRVITGAIAVLMLAVVGLVYAAWTTNGSGSGYAKAGTAGTLSTVSAAASTTADLYPGADGSLKLNIHNPNPYSVTVTDVTAGSGSVTSSGGTGTCTDSGVSLTDQTGLSIAVPASGNSGVVTLNNAVQMAASSDDGCQGATFTIPVDLAGASG